MPTVPEQIASTNAKLDALLPSATPGDGAEETLSAAEILGKMNAELKAGAVSKERAAYHKQVLETLTKNNFEATSFRTIPVLDDPMRTNSKEESIGTIQSIDTGTPDSLFSTNLKSAMTVAQKAALIHKVLTNPEKIQKGAFSDKLDDIVDMFGFTKEDMQQECELRWKISDLVYQLQSAAKLERLVEKSAEKPTEKPAEKPAETLSEEVWPLDMARAQIDPVTKQYKREEPTWGRDKPAAAGR